MHGYRPTSFGTALVGGGSLAFAVGPFLAVTACATSAPELGYRVPATPALVYNYSDTTVVGVAVMGQRMEIGIRGDADYDVAFAPAASGVEVTLTVDRLDGTISAPMAGSRSIDASQVRGPLVFTLEADGDATLVSAPEVSMEASRMLSGLTTTHTFFPGLPARAVAVGDSWVDSISYGGDEEVGAVAEDAVYRYTVVGDTVIEGRALTNIALAGTSTTRATMDLGGMRVTETSTVELTGHVLWDLEAATMFEVVRHGEGTGTARVPLSPQPLPLSLRVTQRARLAAPIGP